MEKGGRDIIGSHIHLCAIVVPPGVNKYIILLCEPCYLMFYRLFCCLLIVMSFIFFVKHNNHINQSLCIEYCQLSHSVLLFIARADYNSAESCGKDVCYSSLNVF